MIIAVLGAKGQLGNELQLKAKHYPNDIFYFADIEEVNITQKDSFESYIKSIKPEIVINAAAYTAVDKAESEAEKAMMVNAKAVELLASLSECYHFSPIHISTDYVFDGTNHKPYHEMDAPHPVSIYGKTKLAGEQALKGMLSRAIIIRTSWLYSSFGNNFVKTMVSLSKEKTSLRVVYDQIGSPTYAADLAEAILQIARQIDKIKGVEVYHYSNEGVCSWYDFAKEIMQATASACEIIPIESKDYPTAAQRPHYSVLNKQKIKKEFNIQIPHWKESLYRCLKTMQLVCF
ncbi:MAG: dTDP-4-dehydrorhamnose reductase [Bacteroidales bacterium]|jgi:dTDP-4-dehydrorhamnose reductase|nr:dTDP-4-dehydrorhamnose reductase [Bacteroidales bacterium]NLO42492.1 dTDP-4-dehydrorhamnose reductase [Bacteroidales bacterium]